jgi:hypothetical protein
MIDPTANCWVKTTGELSPISLLASFVPLETTNSLGAPSGAFCSHSLRSGSICWQKPHPGFQKRTRVFWPLKRARFTFLFLRSRSLTGGASSPILRPAGTVSWAAWPLSSAWTFPQLAQGSPSPSDGASVDPRGGCPHRVGHEGRYGPRAACHGATDSAVGTDEHRPRGTPDLVSLRYLPVLLHRHG